MKLWLITQNQAFGWGTYIGAVVAAKTRDEAKRLDPMYELPHGPELIPEKDDPDDFGDCDYWATSAEHVAAKYIGEAKPGTPMGVILASNAGD